MKKRYIPMALAAALSAGAVTLPASAESTITVKEGDTLSELAAEHQRSIDELMQRNNLSDDTIYTGQSIDLGEDMSVKGTLVHKVQSGETLSGISLQYHTTAASLKTLNNLQSDVIYAGQELQVKTEEKRSTLDTGIFPLEEGTYHPFVDTWGKSREYGGARVHEGTDIFAEEGTPVYAATDGSIARKGWNELGGWRLTVKTPDGFNAYYAHLSKYADGIDAGSEIKRGQLIGYVGDTGYGPEGTSGKFVSHLHFGLYDAEFEAINPYPYLVEWELS
ncbi:LysM peptidoglycan-binding domain-containing protein [Metabacillus sp. 113a]|uniref:M23 family metallopeptidase n=1 Tax=Metabacillus sp. 113a TaxID=3404706 RepID=UPI003CF72752